MTDLERYELKTLQESHDRLLAALEIVEPEIGWRGYGPRDQDIFYCEYCQAWHEDFLLIEHEATCSIPKIRAAIAQAESLTEKG